MRIFLLESLPLKSNAIQSYFHSKNFRVDTFFLYTEAIKAIDNGYKCFIIELDCNITQSLELIKLIRMSYLEVPIIMMSFHNNIDVSVLKKAYKYGCDDVLKKPFLSEELDRKIIRLLHIRQNIVNFGEHGKLDFDTGILICGHIQKRFSKKEKRLLSILYSYRENIVTFKMIQHVVWDGESVSFDSIRSLVHRVRKKISFACIATITNIGYSMKLKH